ncbi:MAG: SusC/RagA family TonB-linked outer membrane protein, partial [Prevotellaceae bacterium]|nr:SusC/RagA family TonB-linked outer membrane protein [Prevotellaceae bacterium]
MLHRFSILFFSCLLLALPAAGQASTTVAGRVADAQGAPLAGVSVSVKGTSVGAMTNAQGEYSIVVPSGNATLVFAFLGMSSREEPVGGRSRIDLKLAELAQNLDDVVVTALGIRRDKKTLAYAATELKEDAFIVREANLTEGLVGKVAGVNVVKPATGASGSTRVTIRGNGSFGGNQPLYVVDGIPIMNPTYEQAGLWGGVDGGDGISSINSDDIESMSILKSGTAAALYGSRAANGVIVITTKKGSKGKVAVEWTSSYTFDRPVFRTDDLQYEYGQGFAGNKFTSAAEALEWGLVSWGARLDGSNVMQFDGVERPYSAVSQNNINNFYGGAWSLNNTLSVSAGNEKTQYRLSVGDTRNEDLYPNSGMQRNNLSLNLLSDLTKNVSLQATAMYVRERVRNRQNVNDVIANGNSTVWLLPPNVDVRTLAPGYDANGMEIPLLGMWLANPYFVANKRSQSDAKDRVIGSLQLRYNITEALYLSGRAGGDMVFRRYESVTPTGTAYNQAGNISANTTLNGEVNAEALFGFKSSIGERWAIHAFAGWNSMMQWGYYMNVYGDRFIMPDFSVMGNTSNTSGGQSRSESYINSLFGQAEVEFADMLFITASGRNDWFSALSLKGKTSPNNIFYPSLGVGFVLSNAVQLPAWMTFLKLRGSWAQSGGSVGPYNLALTYSYDQAFNGNPSGHVSGSTIPNLNLKPLTSETYEAGFDLRFFGNRLGLDATYYVRATRDEIVTAQISGASGYSSVLINAGKISNRGVELLLTATPLKLQGFEWSSSLNFSYNLSRVDYITDKISSFVVAQARMGYAGDHGAPAYIYQQVGEPYGIIMGYAYRRENGKIKYDKDGYPEQGKLVKLGESVHPYTGGFSNTFTYRGIALRVLVDGKFGGSIFSGTNNWAYYLGTHRETLNGREGGVVGVGIKPSGHPNDKAVPAMEYYSTLANRI